MAQTSHYKLTPARRESITTVVVNRLRRRVESVQAVCPLDGEKMEKLFYTDDQPLQLRSVAGFYGKNIYKADHINVSLKLGTPQGPVEAWFIMHNVGEHYAPQTESDSIYLSQVRGIYHYRGSVHRISAHHYFDIDYFDIDGPGPEGDDRLQIIAEFREWAELALLAMRRFDLGATILTEVLDRTTTLTEVAATIPFIRAPLVDAGYDVMVKELDRAPVRTLSNYKVHGLDPVRIQALKELVAEGMMMPVMPVTEYKCQQLQYGVIHRS